MTTRERELECVIADLTEECKRLRGELEEAKRPYFQEMREMLRAMQAGELTVSRGIEILEIWYAGNWDDSMLPPVRQDLIEEDSMPVEIIDRMKAQLAAKAADIEKLRSALNKCADKFHDYAEIHSMKEQTSENIEKIERNLEMARMADDALAATQDDCAILRSHASDIDVANRIEEIALALDGHFSYERGLDPYIDELNKLAAKIRNGEEV